MRYYLMFTDGESKYHVELETENDIVEIEEVAKRVPSGFGDRGMQNEWLGISFELFNEKDD